jgi:hypothetical protein
MKTLKIALTLAFIWGYNNTNTVLAVCPPDCCLPPYCSQPQCDSCEPGDGQQPSDE